MIGILITLFSIPMDSYGVGGKGQGVQYFLLFLNSIKDNKDMTYENYKKGMFRVFIVLSIPLELVPYQY